MREVSREEFYKRIGPLDVHPRIVNDRWPYVSMWEMHHQAGRPCVGKSVGRTDGSYVYFLLERQA